MVKIGEYYSQEVSETFYEVVRNLGVTDKVLKNLLADLVHWWEQTLKVNTISDAQIQLAGIIAGYLLGKDKLTWNAMAGIQLLCNDLVAFLLKESKNRKPEKLGKLGKWDAFIISAEGYEEDLT